MSVLDNIEPRLVWKHFEEISRIPRCSKHEEKIRKYIIDFAKRQGLKHKSDDAGNIVVIKPASKGFDDKPIVILQSHMDMVCEKNTDIVHDFSKDPLKLKLEGDTLSAQGTTLGADDGIGVSVTLAVLEDKNLRHGPIEALFTVDEETGLTGAFAIKPDLLQGRIMINLDSEEFGVITVGCAGGGDSRIELPLKYKPITRGRVEGLDIKITGLKGGHSGVNIKEQRGNAIKILTRLLWKANEQYRFHIADIHGGDKHNAIPREAFATVVIDKKDKDGFTGLLKREMQDITEEIKPIDPDCTISIEPNNKVKKIYDKKLQDKLLLLLHGLPHGVLKMSYDIPGLVQTSTNLAVVKTNGKNIEILMSSRSAVKTELNDTRDRIKAIARLAGAKIAEDKPYPGWKPNMDSKLLALSRRIYRDMFSEEAKVEAVHAGLECGIIGERFPGIDMISIGATIKYLHSPNEQVSVSSVEKLYRYLLRMIENI